jgi:HPt (histidine-containing phosphotransfer) domain-containing protein
VEIQMPEPVEQAVLDQLAEEIGDLGEVIGLYLRALPARCGAIAQALARGDREAVVVASHTLGTASSFLGARRLAQQCGRLEAEARSGEPLALKRGVELRARITPPGDATG